MNILRTAIRLPLIGLHVVVGMLLCVFALPSGEHRPWSLRQRGIVRWWLRTCARLIGVRIHVHGKPVEGASLVVSNHISWIDVIILGGLQHVSLLSKAEIARWPIVGYLARKSGTLFIKRGVGAEAATRLIGDRLRAGTSVAFFPEGTTSDGTEMRRFHPRLFTAAIDAGAPVQPVSIAYPARPPSRPRQHLPRPILAKRGSSKTIREATLMSSLRSQLFDWIPAAVCTRRRGWGWGRGGEDGERPHPREAGIQSNNREQSELIAGGGDPVKMREQSELNGIHPVAPFPPDVSFFAHALSVIGEPHIHAVVRYTDSLPTGDSDRTQLAARARELMVAEQNKDR